MKLLYIHTVFLVSLSICKIGFAQHNFNNAWRNKIAPVVLSSIAQHDSVEVMIELNEQADLNNSRYFNSKEDMGRYVFKKLTETANASQENIIAYLKDRKISYTSFWIINAVYAKADSTTLYHIAKQAEVKNILYNSSFRNIKAYDLKEQPDNGRGVEWNISKIKADKVWEKGIKGKGVVVGGQDSGYEYTHPAIKNQYRGWDGTNYNHNHNWFDALTGSKTPKDEQSHGTHTMGTMVGDDGGTNKIGVAPEAKWIGARCLDKSNNGTFKSYTTALQWFAAPTDLDNKNPDPAKAPHVINNSWECTSQEGCDKSNFPALEKIVTNLRAAGIVVVVSTGNDGPNCTTITKPPAIFEGSFTVGSTTSSDAIANMSSRGPIKNYGAVRVGPDVCAPGDQIRSSVPGSKYSNMSGTSMAGPHVTGLVALVISANPALAGKVDAIENIIIKTAVKLKSSQNCDNMPGDVIPNNTFGNGRIDALAAVEEAINTSFINNEVIYNEHINVFPNPFNEKVTFEFSGWDNTVIFDLYTITGQKLLTETWTINQHKEVNLAGLNSGIYYYSVRDNKSRTQGKLLKK